jgi:hypothetical protein
MLIKVAEGISTNVNTPKRWNTDIIAAPIRPPITNVGPKKLMPPPEPTEIDVANIFTNIIAKSIQIGRNS